jgi:hypothetical protein
MHLGYRKVLIISCSTVNYITEFGRHNKLFFSYEFVVRKLFEPMGPLARGKGWVDRGVPDIVECSTTNTGRGNNQDKLYLYRGWGRAHS